MGKIKLEKLLISKDRVDYWFTTTAALLQVTDASLYAV